MGGGELSSSLSLFAMLVLIVEGGLFLEISIIVLRHSVSSLEFNFPSLVLLCRQRSKSFFEGWKCGPDICAFIFMRAILSLDSSRGFVLFVLLLKISAWRN